MKHADGEDERRDRGLKVKEKGEDRGRRECKPSAKFKGELAVSTHGGSTRPIHKVKALAHKSRFDQFNLGYCTVHGMTIRVDFLAGFTHAHRTYTYTSRGVHKVYRDKRAMKDPVSFESLCASAIYRSSPNIAGKS